MFISLNDHAITYSATTMASLSSDMSSLGVAILHNKLKDSVLVRLLSQRQIKFRTSERLLEGAVIFPKAKLAFLVLNITKKLHLRTSSDNNQAPGPETDSFVDLTARFDKFISTHRQCVVILQAPLFTSEELALFSQLQFKYLKQCVDFLPAHSAETCVDAMLTLASVQTPPACDVLHERMSDLMNNLLQPPDFLSSFSLKE